MHWAEHGIICEIADQAYLCSFVLCVHGFAQAFLQHGLHVCRARVAVVPLGERIALRGDADGDSMGKKTQKPIDWKRIDGEVGI